MSWMVVIYHHDNRIGPIDRMPDFETEDEAKAIAADCNAAYSRHNNAPESTKLSHWHYEVEEIP